MFSRVALSFCLSVLLVLSISACDRSETVDRFYRNYEDLSKANEPGNWIPGFIPRSAVEIRERHKIDTGAEVLTFYVHEYEDMLLEGSCKKISVKDVDLPASGFLRVTWWPQGLFRDQAMKEVTDRYEYYKCERQAFLAMTRVGERIQVFYWRISYK